MAELKCVERPIIGKPEDIRAILAGTKTQMRVKFPGEPFQYELEDRKHPEEWWLQDPSTRRGWIGNARGRRQSDAKGRFDPNEPIEWSYLDKDAWLRSVCPLGEVGDRLWMRETFCPWRRTSIENPYEFDTGKDALGGLTLSTYYEERGQDGLQICYRADSPEEEGPWFPSTNMPRWAARIVLKITQVRVQRLQEISEVDAVAEGVYRNQEGNGGGWRYAEDQPTYSFAASAYRELWNLQHYNSWDLNPLVWALTFKRVEAAGGQK